MCNICDQLRAKCFILFPLAEIGNKVEIEVKLKEINGLLDSLNFTNMEKQGLKYSLNNIKM